MRALSTQQALLRQRSSSAVLEKWGISPGAQSAESLRRKLKSYRFSGKHDWEQIRHSSQKAETDSCLLLLFSLWASIFSFIKADGSFCLFLFLFFFKAGTSFCLNTILGESSNAENIKVKN